MRADVLLQDAPGVTRPSRAQVTHLPARHAQQREGVRPIVDVLQHHPGPTDPLVVGAQEPLGLMGELMQGEQSAKPL